MEIERKYLVHEIPVDLTKYQVKHMEQMYVSVKPVIRIRRTDDRRVLTVKSKGLLSRQEFEWIWTRMNTGISDVRQTAI